MKMKKELLTKLNTVEKQVTDYENVRSMEKKELDAKNFVDGLKALGIEKPRYMDAEGNDIRYENHNYALQAPDKFLRAICGNEDKDSISGLTGVATNAFDTYTSIYIKAIIMALNEGAKDEDIIKYAINLLKALFINVSITFDGKEYKVGDESNTLKYEELPRVTEDGVDKILVSDTFATKTFAQIHVCKFNTVDDLILLFEDIDAIGRFYSESIIDSVKTAETINIDFLLQKQGQLMIKPAHLCSMEIIRELNIDEDKEEHLDENGDVAKYKYRTALDKPKTRAKEKNQVKVESTIQGDVVDALSETVIEKVKSVDNNNILCESELTLLKQYTNVIEYNEGYKFIQLLNQNSRNFYNEIADLEKGDPKYNLARAKMKEINSTIADAFRSYIKRIEKVNNVDELYIKSFHIALACSLMQRSDYGKRAKYSISNKVTTTRLLDALEFERLVYALTINVTDKYNPSRKVIKEFGVQYNITFNERDNIKDFHDCTAFVSNIDGVIIGVVTNDSDEFMAFNVLDDRMLKVGKSMVGKIFNGKFVVDNEVVEPEYKDNLYLVRSSATNDIVDISGNLIEVEKVLYSTMQCFLKEEDQQNPNKYNFIVKGKVVGQATEEQLAYHKIAKEEEVSSEELEDGLKDLY